MRRGHPDYKGSSFNVFIKWEDGSQSYEPLDAMAADDPLLCMLVQTISWIPLTGFRHIATAITKKRNEITSMIHQYHVSKGKGTHGTILKFGIQVPCNVKEAYKLDAKNGNTKWQDAMKEEIDARSMFITFIDHGKIPYLEGYKNTIVHFVFDVKHDLRHKASCCWRPPYRPQYRWHLLWCCQSTNYAHCYHCRRNEQSKDYGW
jgi:hypothetical protein